MRLSAMAGRTPARGGKASKDSSKLNERSGNVIENKGAMWKTGERSGNVVENKGTYGLYPGML
jgi:hypothetical protein